MAVPEPASPKHYHDVNLFVKDKNAEIVSSEGQVFKAEGITVRPDSIQWLDRSHKRRHAIRSSAVAKIIVSSRQQGAQNGLAVGALSGVAIGALLGYTTTEDDGFLFDKKAGAAIGGLAGLFLGGMSGAVIGSLGGKAVIVVDELKSDEGAETQ